METELTPAQKRRATIIKRYGSVTALGKIVGAKAAKTNRERYGDNYYDKLGEIGGKTPTTKPKGFAANLELASIAGAKGGKASRRTFKRES